MPYFLYKLYPDRKLDYITEHDKFRPAKLEARAMREELPSDAGYQIKVMFAENQKQAELLLKEEREPRPRGDD